MPRLPADVARPNARLRTAVARALTSDAPVVRVPLPAPNAPPLTWLTAQTADSRAYWHGRGGEDAWAGVGLADQCSGPEALPRLRRRLASLDDPAVRYLGGTAFAPAAPVADEWSAFGGARFILPRFVFRRDDGTPTLSLFVRPGRDRLDAVLAEVAALREPVVGFGALPLPTSRTDAPDAEGWNVGLQAAFRAFARGELHKVVLARRATYGFDERLDALALLARLEAATPSCFHFALQPAHGSVFVGATPERLFRREGRRLWTEAVAGTRPRLADPAADARLRDDLLASEKDRREHAYVTDRILDALAPFCAACDADDTRAMGLASKWHLHTAIRAGLKPDVDTFDLLDALHPTPAVGGTPTAPALARIAATEPFDRGWYAGPIGWVSRDDAEFAVAIRSGLVRDTEAGSALDLYSGAGIVRGSDPATEWAEIEDKIVDFARVLGLDS